jgi:hypothetical protein
MHPSPLHCHHFFAALFESVEKELPGSPIISSQTLCSDWRTHLLQPDVRSNLYSRVAALFWVCCLAPLLALAECGL